MSHAECKGKQFIQGFFRGGGSNEVRWLTKVNWGQRLSPMCCALFKWHFREFRTCLVFNLNEMCTEVIIFHNRYIIQRHCL